jgi:uncharacterized protein
MTVTPLYAGLLALLFFALSLRVVQMRGTGISLGDGGNTAMLRRIRGHANFAEYVPLVLIMMALLELSKFSIYVLHAIGVTLFVARLLHGYALSFTEKFKFGRFWGTLLTYIVMVVAGVLCIYQGIRASAL